MRDSEREGGKERGEGLVLLGNLAQWAGLGCEGQQVVQADLRLQEAVTDWLVYWPLSRGIYLAVGLRAGLAAARGEPVPGCGLCALPQRALSLR